MGTAPSEDHSSNNRGQGNNPDHRNLFYGNKGSMLHIPFHKLSLKHLSSILVSWVSVVFRENHSPFLYN